MRALNMTMAAVLMTAVATASATDITVSAAASLTNAFKEIGAAYEKDNAGDKVHFNFAASDPLVQQISKGAPVDVFASADQEAMDKAESLKLLAPGTRRNFVTNSLVLIAPANSKLALKGIADLQQATVTRVTMGNPASVPVGRYAKQADIDTADKNLSTNTLHAVYHPVEAERVGKMGAHKKGAGAFVLSKSGEEKKAHSYSTGGEKKEL